MKMYFSFILLMIGQIFSGHFCQVNSRFNGLSREFTRENVLPILSDFQNRSLSPNISYDCNISLIIDFYPPRGSIEARCYNKSQNSDRTLDFNVIMAFNDTGFSYVSVANDVCLFNNSCDRSLIENWISWQKKIIPKIIQVEKKNKFNFIKFQLWSLLYYNETDLYFQISSNQNESRYFSHENEIIDNITRSRLPCRYNYENILSNISALIIKLSQLVTLNSSLNDEKIVIQQMLTTFFNITHSIDGCTTSWANRSQAIPKEKTSTTHLNQSKNGNHRQLLILVLIIVVVVLGVSIICFIYCNAYRPGYRLTATS